MSNAHPDATWTTLAQAITDPKARVADVGRISNKFLLLLQDIPWMGASFGFERALSTHEPPEVDLALHLDPSTIPSAGTSAAWDRLRAHPVWKQTLMLPTLVDRSTDIALEFDAARAHQGTPLPVVFLVRDDLISGPTQPWHRWVHQVRTSWLPAARCEAALPEGLDRGLRRVLAALAPSTRAVHFGSLAVRDLDAVRLCVSGATASQMPSTLDRLGLSLADLGDPDGTLIQALATLGDLRFVNLDIVGEHLLPRLGLELHLPAAPTRQGLCPLARQALETLAEHGLVHADEIASLHRWCGLDANGLARTLTHLKLQLTAGQNACLKAYLKVSPPRAASVSPALQRTEPAIPTRLQDGFLRQLAVAPDAPALQQDGVLHSYRTLDSASLKVAQQLRDLGVGQGDLVGIFLPHGPLQAAAALGVLRIGAAYVPADPSWPASRVEEVFTRAGTTAVLLSEPSLNIAALRVTSSIWTADPVPHDDPSRAGDRAYIIYTSGSTGHPKGVVLTHQAVTNTLDDVRAHCALCADDRVLALSSLAFDLSVFDIFGTLAAGGTVVYPDTGTASLAQRAARALTHDDISVWNSVPATLGLTLDFLPEPANLSLRWALLSGDWIPTSLPTRVWKQLGSTVQVTSLGGSTEGAIWSIMHPLTPADLHEASVPYGRPTSMIGQAVVPVRADGSPCALGEVGELIISGAGVAAGYHNAPELTERRFPIDPHTGHRSFRTGDFGRLEVDGLLRFLGRRDAQVKIRGYRVDLSEVSAELRALPAVTDVAVGVVVESGLPPRLVAVVVADRVDAATIVQQLAQRLPGYAVPLTPDVRLVAALPLTANGKVDRSSMFGSGPTTPPPASDVLSVLQRALAKPNLGTTDDLFEHGADSLAAAWIARALEDSHGRPVGVVDIYSHPSAEALTTWLSKAEVRRPVERTAPDLPADVHTRDLSIARLEAPVFLTGGTGQLGPHTLHALRTQGQRVLCLVRASSEPHARQRIRRALANAGLPTHLDGVDVVTGDLSRPRFGLGEPAFLELGRRVGRIVHMGAAVGFFRPRSELEQCNIRGTVAVLRLATTATAHPVCFVSTAAVHGLLHAERTLAPEAVLSTPPTSLGVTEGSYPWTKWAAERLVHQAGSRGLQVSIVRPALVLGHRGSGAVTRGDDLLAAALRISLRVAAMAVLPWSVPVLPTDVVGQAIATIAMSDTAAGKIHQLAPTEGLSLTHLAEDWRDQGLAIREVPWTVWRGLVETLAAQGDRDARLVLRATSDDLHTLTPPDLVHTHAKQQVGSLSATCPSDLRQLLTANPVADHLQRLVAAINAYIEGLCWPPDPHGTALNDAILDGFHRRGKRLRPAICLAIATGEGVALDHAMPIAAALELIHTMSLVYDDLPCMDDADQRRQQPSLHRVHGEARAVLAGNAMLVRAFELVAENTTVSAQTRVQICAVLARSCGGEGLAAGQAFDLFGRGRPHSAAALEALAAQKTGALFAAACRTGAVLAGAPDLVEPLDRFGRHLGVIFQVADDLQDVRSTSESLGKPTGRDAEQQVPSLVQQHGVRVAQAVLQRHREACEAELNAMGERAFVPVLAHILAGTVRSAGPTDVEEAKGV